MVLVTSIMTGKLPVVTGADIVDRADERGSDKIRAGQTQDLTPGADGEKSGVGLNHSPPTFCGWSPQT